jgi:diguanylate cyclase (GGDEF)-like protein/PAS domain S-box-containing protein
MEKEFKQLSQVFESWGNGVILESADGIILSWNKGAQELYGYSADEIKGKPHSYLVPPDVEDSINKIKGKIIHGENIAWYEAAHMRKDGSRINVSLTVSPLRNESGDVVVFSILVNNTAEQEQEKELFSAITHSSPIGIYIVRDRKICYINHQFETIVGFNMNELMSTKVLSYIHPDDRELVRNNAINSLKTGVCQPYEYRVVTKSGKIKWILETVISIRYKGERATLGNFMDITESKHLQEETRQANEKLTMVVKKLEEQQRQTVILTEMRDMLQACTKMEETAPIIMGYMKKLFPASQGALFLLSNSRSDLESIVTWGDFPTEPDDNVFTPDACWGLRRGRAHVVDNVNMEPICPHLKHSPPSPYVCLPLMAKGDILGLLHLKNAFNSKDLGQNYQISDLREMANTLSEYLSLSIANVKLSESLSMQSIQDPQSGLYNRRFMEESLQREIARAARKHAQIGIIMADLDHFKQFNDVYGHAAGDKIISQMGKLLKEKFRGSDIACRYGGEEFLVILLESSLEDTIRRANEIREEIKNMEVVFQNQVLGTITVSMGVAEYPDYGNRMDDLLRVADTALYKAKQEGRDRVISG